MDPGKKWDEKDIYLGEIEAPPAPRKGNPLLLLVGAFLLASGWGAWLMHQRAEARRTAELKALEARAAGLQPGAPGAEGAAGGAVPAPKPDPEARPAPVPSAAPPNQRRFFGVVFDLATRKPLSAAFVELSVDEGRSVVSQSCQASLNGHYACDASTSYDRLWVRVSSQGYVGQFEDLHPTLVKRSEAERRTVLAQRDGYLEPALVTFVPSEESVRVDLAAVTAEWAAAAQRKR